MRRIIGRFFAVVGGLTVLVGLLAAAALLVMRAGHGEVARNTVLELNLRSGVVEQQPSDPFSQFQSQGEPTVASLVFGLEQAAKDARVKGLIVRVGSSPMLAAHAQEIRDAILEFRKSKKFAVAYTEEFAPDNSGFTSYYLATACDEIRMQPGSIFGVSGLRYQVPFIRGTLDKLDVAPRFEGRKEYKNAINSYLEKKFTPTHKEAEQRLLDSTYSQMTRGIAQSRKLTEAEARLALEGGPHSGDRAMQLKLIDGLAYRDEVYDRAKSRAGKDAKLLWLGVYSGRADKIHEKGKRVALIYGSGAITQGKSGMDPLEGPSMGSETVGAAFRKAIDDKSVKAILFRVDSPGGDVVASETIWREVARAKAAGKPVVVSMSGLAASGGYYVSMNADRIVAQPGTITGSIGVFVGKMYTKGLWDKLGVSFDSVRTSPNAAMFDGYEDFTPQQWTVVRAVLDSIYEQFTTRVAAGRKLPKEKVLEIARGRVWTGEDAKERGLVDELGGLPAAIRAVKRLAKIPEGEDIELKVYPPAKGKLEALLDWLMGEESESSDPQKEAVSAMWQAAKPAVRILRQLEVTRSRQDWLLTPPIGWE